MNFFCGCVETVENVPANYYCDFQVSLAVHRLNEMLKLPEVPLSEQKWCSDFNNSGS